MRQSMSTIVIAERALLREGLVSLLQHTPYKVIAAAARASELKDVRVTPGQRTLALLQIEGAHSNVEEVSESIGLLRSLFSDCRVVVIAEGGDPIDIQRIVTFAPDGYILNLGSSDMLVKLLELTLMDQQVFVLGHRTPPRTRGYPEPCDHEGAGPLPIYRTLKFFGIVLCLTFAPGHFIAPATGLHPRRVEAANSDCPTLTGGRLQRLCAAADVLDLASPRAGTAGSLSITF